MSVYPQFLQHIHARGLYAAGYNYEEMYNIMVYTITNNVIQPSTFIYTYQQINELYEYLDELLYTNHENEENEETQINQINQINETNEANNINQMNQNYSDTDSDLDDIYENEETDYSHLTPIQLFANYIQNSTQEYQNTFNLNPNMYNINTPNTNIVYNNNI
jgi:hypothetical protein